MKKLLSLFVLVILCSSLSGQKSVNNLIDKMKEHKNAYALTLPGWLVRTGIKLIGEDKFKFENGFNEFIGGIKKLRVLHIDDRVQIENKKLKSAISQIKEKDGYVDYATIREDGSLMHVIVKEDDTKIKSLVIVANSEDGFTILHLKTDIEMEDLKNANLSFNKSKESQM